MSFCEGGHQYCPDYPKTLFCHLDDPPPKFGGGGGEIFNILRYNKTLNTAHKVLKTSPPQQARGRNDKR